MDNTEAFQKEDGIQRMRIAFGKGKEEWNVRKSTNSVRTSKYTWITWAPLSLLYQFTRAANIYFLIISILTFMPFSPKSPASMIGTFSAVLVFTMFKELFEDYSRMKSDKEINNSSTSRFDFEKGDFEEITWSEVKVGDIIKVEKDQNFCADLLFLYSRTDVIFVDTMNLDGETNLKPKVLSSLPMVDMITKDNIIANKEGEGALPEISLDKLKNLRGTLECENPNENLEQWDANLILSDGNPTNLKISNLLLRGCFLRNVEYCYGIVVYTGKETKIMKNAKKPPRKVSNLMRMMNYMLYTVFMFQIWIITLYATLSVIWINNKGKEYDYLDLDSGSAGFGTWIIQLLTYWVAYSHMIPISLYVIIEVLKLVQSYLIKWDDLMYDEETDKNAECRNSDLIEELGQIDFIFSDKTGTLTCNKMVFKKWHVDGKTFSVDENDNEKAPFEDNEESKEHLFNNDQVKDVSSFNMNDKTLNRIGEGVSKDV